MSDQDRLYWELDNVRESLRQAYHLEHGKYSAICTDDALSALCKYHPHSLAELAAVPGVGKVFIESYGQRFLDVINRAISQDNSTIPMSDHVCGVMKELEKKLVSISKRNRLLYMPKLSSKYAFDLIDNEISNSLDILFGRQRSVTICDLSRNVAKETKKYKSVTALLRENNKDMRDKGQNSLYLGYPFVIGRIMGEKFDVRCPLALFPIVAQRTPTSVSIQLDDSRDIIYNSTLILAFNKFNNVNSSLPNCVIEEVDGNSFIQNLLEFYKNANISIEEKKHDLSKCEEYRSEEFPTFNNGELYLEHNVILGKFPVCSSAIQKDFEDILDTGRINILTNDLLKDVNDLEDICNEPGCVVGAYRNPNVVFEKNLTYINDIDSSQEQVLSAVDSVSRLVVQGPPGTGKSQVITNLIAKYALKDKKVLMISEKKTALDVVYSRLGEISKFALLIDDVNDKDEFYKQLEKIVSLGGSSYQKVDCGSLTNSIQEKIGLLDNLAKALYKRDEFGVEPYRLFLETRKIDFIGQSDDVVREIVNRLTYQDKKTKFAEWTAAFEKFSNEKLADTLCSYQRIISSFPWMENLKSDLGEIDFLDMLSDLDVYSKKYEEYNSSNFVVKIFKSARLRRAAQEFAGKYFISVDESITNLLLNSLDVLRSGLEFYSTYVSVRPLYLQLSENEKRYCLLLLETLERSDLSENANQILYTSILYYHLQLFIKEHRAELSTVDNFPNILSEISKLIEEKKAMTRRQLRGLLISNLCEFVNAKRGGEIRRIIESKRKWNVNRFVNRFRYELLDHVKIWLLTPEVVSEIMPLESGLFDLVVFDEASQMYIERGIPSLYRAKKVVVAGDHMQLRPSSLGSGRVDSVDDDISLEDDIIDSSAALEEESLLDLARFRYDDIMLNFHYRSKYEELIAFSNFAFYKGKLYVSPNVQTLDKPPIEYHMIRDAVWKNRCNEKEAKYVVALLKDIFRERTGNETIGIITFNTAQRDLIEDEIDAQCRIEDSFSKRYDAEVRRSRDGEDIGLFIKNIESVQGDERDIIIFSIGYAKNEEGRFNKQFGWLNQKGGENRLNVAISRAKQKVHVVASFLPEEFEVDSTKNEGPRILKKYLQYAHCVSQGDLHGTKQILNSFLETDKEKEDELTNQKFISQVKEKLDIALEGRQFAIEERVGVGGYTLELAIRRDSEYLLGIEFDCNLYDKQLSSRERDFHRLKYLELRGWKIFRVWSTEWRENPEAVIDQICDLVGAR